MSHIIPITDHHPENGGQTIVIRFKPIWHLEKITFDDSFAVKGGGLEKLFRLIDVDYRDYQFLGFSAFSNRRKDRATSDELELTHHSFINLIAKKQGVVYMIQFFVPKTIKKHWLFGTFYGYPQCCITEHMDELEKSRQSTGAPDFSFFTNRKLLIAEKGLPAGGPLWCKHCVENFTSEYLEKLAHHRRCPDPIFKGKPGPANWLLALVDYMNHDLKPWTAKTVH